MSQFQSGNNWNAAVKDAVLRVSQRNKSLVVTRQQLLTEEMTNIISATGTSGKTPEQTLSRVLQDLRNDGFLLFYGSGTYLVSEHQISIDSFDLDDQTIDEAITKQKLLLESVPTSNATILSRRRRGQERLRQLVLSNYSGQCALCDVKDPKFLIASHITRWTDDPENRGNLRNAICLCRLHDALFENGYIAFTDELGILQSPHLESQFLQEVVDITSHFRRPVNFEPSATFLKLHRQRVGFEL